MGLGLGISDIFGSFPDRYKAKVLGLQPADLVAYWPLDELSGLVADNLEGTAALDGAYTGVTLASAPNPVGGQAGLWDGVNDYCNIYTAALNSAFDGAEGTLSVWAKVSAAGVWTDSNYHHVIDIRSADSDYVVMRKSNGNNNFDFLRRAGAGVDTNVLGISLGGTVGTSWFHVALTFSESAGSTGELKAYVNGVQVGSTQTGLGAWSGVLVSNQCTIGAFTTNPNLPWDGYLAHAVIWSAALDADQVAELAVS